MQLECPATIRVVVNVKLLPNAISLTSQQHFGILEKLAEIRSSLTTSAVLRKYFVS